MKNARILIVEDEALMVEAIRRVLHLAGCEQVDNVSCGEEAVKQAAETNPDLILMDIHLAGKMDGIEAARSIHQHQTIPLIFLTGDSNDTIAELAKETGPWGYLNKPFSPQSLLNAIELALQKSREYTAQTDQLIQAKSQSEEMLADFFENASELIQQVAPDGRLVYVNRAWRETLGYDAAEILGLSLQDLIHPQDVPHCMDLFQRIMTGEEAKDLEVRFIKKDGGTVVLEGSSSCRFENGIPTLTRSIFHDVTERRRRQIQERIQTDIRDAVWRMDLDGDIQHVLLSLRDGLLELGLPFAECGVNVLERGADKELMHFFNLTREGDAVRLFTTDVAAHAGAQLVARFVQNAAPTYRPDLAESDSYGERANFEGTHGESIRTLLDVPFTHGTLAVSSYVPNAFSSDDITTLEHLAKVLSEGFRRRDDLRRIRESEARYRTLVETPNIGVFLVDFNGCYTYVSPSVESLMGYAPAEFCADPHISRCITHPDDRVRELDVFRRARTGESIRDHELRLRHRDGSYRWFISSVFPLANSSGTIDTLQIVIQDITKRKNAEAKLEQLNRTLEEQVAERTAALRQLSNAVEQTADMVMITDREGIVEYVNPAFEQLTGYKKEEVIGKTPNILNSDQHPPGHFAELWQTITSGQVYRGNIIDQTKTGERFYSEKTITPLRNERGEITHFVSTDRDITYRVQAEKRQLQLEQSLIQSERMASVGTAAAGIVHNLKGFLQHILINAEFLSMEYAEAEGAKDITSTVMQMSQMIEDILAKSRQTKSPEAIDFNALVHRELDFLQAHPDFKHDVNKQISLAENLPVTMGVYTDFSQIFGNLLRNAVDAMHDCDQKQLSVSTALDGEHIVVEIADSGCGIPSSILPQLFDPFFTTKSSNGEDGKPMGTGLGLYTVRELLNSYNATIAVESEEGRGNLFRVRIPVST